MATCYHRQHGQTTHGKKGTHIVPGFMQSSHLNMLISSIIITMVWAYNSIFIIMCQLYPYKKIISICKWIPICLNSESKYDKSTQKNDSSLTTHLLIQLWKAIHNYLVSYPKAWPRLSWHFTKYFILLHLTLLIEAIIVGLLRITDGVRWLWKVQLQENKILVTWFKWLLPSLSSK